MIGPAPLDPRWPIHEILRPLPLAGLALMVANDHVFRVRWPGLVTGKLSDFAVLLYLPAFLTASLGLALLVWHRVAPRWGGVDPSLSAAKAVAATVAAGLSLVLLKLFPAVRDEYLAALSTLDVFQLWPPPRLQCDATDLVALVVLPLPLWDALAVVRAIPGRRLDLLRARALAGSDARAIVSAGLADVRWLAARAVPEAARALAALERALIEPGESGLAVARAALIRYRALWVGGPSVVPERPGRAETCHVEGP